MRLVDIQNLTVRLGSNIALHDVSLGIESGEIITIVGPNGSGKSTLLRAIIGALKPTTGKIQKSDNLRVGYVPQRLHVDPTLPMTVGRFLGLPHRVDAAQILQALKQAGVPELSDRQMSRLSGGQFQRVLLARALMNRPDLLILDEATQGLDQPGSAAFLSTD